MRTIIIGDVHGHSGSLNALLSFIKPEPGKDKLVFLGDLFDRGPDSYGVFCIVKQLAEAFTDDFILLLGNHEDYLLQPCLSKQQKNIWEHVGRNTTVTSFEMAGSHMEDSIPWLSEHVRLYWKAGGFQCVHAGLLIDPPEVNDLDTLIHNHETVIKNRYAGPLTITGHIALEHATWFAGDEETVEELSENNSLQLPKTGVICIDTGCGKGGKLTAIVIDRDMYTLYSMPEE